ncbi:Homoserine dehydrogenase [Venturia nashicola]|nr:Homoserine dehydrogenase [Venturia nashicola]
MRQVLDRVSADSNMILRAGTVGDGLREYVREAYSFLSNNYSEGDEIFLLGFSRGAFTVRAVAGIIATVGLLTKKGLAYWPEIFRDVMHRRDPRYSPKNPDIPFRNKPNADNPQYRDELYRRGLSDLNVTVKAIGVWDTVGALGLPRINFLTRVGLQTDQSREMTFYDTKLSNCVENAFQALALDERRTAFSPAVWEKPANNRTKLRQVWFPGVHSNVGGGYDDQELANISLAWMMSQLSPFLDMYSNYIIQQEDENIEYYRSRHKKVRPWSFGKIYNSMGGLYAIGGGTTRTPGAYYAVNPEDGRSTDRPLRDTHEYIHPSVRTRILDRGPGTDDKGDYEPEAMDEWKLVIEYPHGLDARPEVYWKARFADKNVSSRILPESPLGVVERKLLGLDEDMEQEVLWPKPTRRRDG